MRVRGSCGCRYVPVISATLLAACGGGGSGYTAPPPISTPPPTPMPTVSFTAPAQGTTIKFGRAVNLTWSSTNATSCTASASSTAGGAFTGSVSPSGSATIAPTGPGTVTYTVTCTGTGGSASATTSSVTVSPSILSTLSVAGITEIGSAMDPVTGDYNPYGLTIAPATAGLITKGDLVVCNFNAGGQTTQGTGTTIVGLHPTAGSMPYRIAQSADLQGCNALSGQCTSVMAPPTPAPTFTGPAASSARVIANGGGFFTPLSAALLSDGDLIVANADINITTQTPNQVFEISPVLPGGFVGQPLQLDTGNPGALFGLATTVDSQMNQIVYFNDDNSNAVMMITVAPSSGGAMGGMSPEPY